MLQQNQEVNQEREPASVAQLNVDIRGKNGHIYPVYITDDIHTYVNVKRSNVGRSKVICYLTLDFTIKDLKEWFTPNRIIGSNDSPVVFLVKDRKKTEPIINIFIQAGIVTYYIDVNRYYEIFTANSPEEVKEHITAIYSKNFSCLQILPDLKNRIKEGKNGINKPISTGFNELNSIIGGGIYPGLFVIAAEPGGGKTTFALQIASKIAADTQKDVYFFSLEMSKYELIGRIISRMTAERTNNLKFAKSELGITDGSRYINYNSEELRLIDESMNEFENKIAPHLYIHESVGTCTPNVIRREVQELITNTHQTPVIIVDYLQILQAEDKYINSSDKSRIDTTITELKRISRDFNTPVICISSMSRAKYNTTSDKLNIDCFKESGGIEYTADIAAALVTRKESTNQGIKKRYCRLEIMKNRKGERWQSVDYEYTPIFNRFEEIPTE